MCHKKVQYTLYTTVRCSVYRLPPPVHWDFFNAEILWELPDWNTGLFSSFILIWSSNYSAKTRSCKFNELSAIQDSVSSVFCCRSQYTNGAIHYVYCTIQYVIAIVRSNEIPWLRAGAVSIYQCWRRESTAWLWLCTVSDSAEIDSALNGRALAESRTALRISRPFPGRHRVMHDILPLCLSFHGLHQNLIKMENIEIWLCCSEMSNFYF